MSLLNRQNSKSSTQNPQNLREYPAMILLQNQTLTHDQPSRSTLVPFPPPMTYPQECFDSLSPFFNFVPGAPQCLFPLPQSPFQEPSATLFPPYNVPFTISLLKALYLPFKSPSISLLRALQPPFPLPQISSRSAPNHFPLHTKASPHTPTLNQRPNNILTYLLSEILLAPRAQSAGRELQTCFARP